LLIFIKNGCKAAGDAPWCQLLEHMEPNDDHHQVFSFDVGYCGMESNGCKNKPFGIGEPNFYKIANAPPIKELAELILDEVKKHEHKWLDGKCPFNHNDPNKPMNKHTSWSIWVFYY